MKKPKPRNAALQTPATTLSVAPPVEFDRTLLAMMLRLTPEERLEWLGAQLRAIEEVRRAVRS